MDETTADDFDRPHPAATREQLSDIDTDLVEAEIDEMLGEESVRLQRAQDAF